MPMNDNWTQPFQDKLGDWEMDVPVATPVHSRRGWLLPAAAAAAAALILLLLLPDSGKKPAVQPAVRLLAEATPASIRAASPALPPVSTFAVRHRHAAHQLLEIQDLIRRQHGIDFSHVAHGGALHDVDFLIVGRIVEH